VTLDFLTLHERAIRDAVSATKLIRAELASGSCWRNASIAKIVPELSRRIIERACETIKLRANADGECVGGEIMDSLREAGVELGANHIEILRAKNLLVRSMESGGEAYPADILQDYANRIPISTALRFLNQALVRID